VLDGTSPLTNNTEYAHVPSPPSKHRNPNQTYPLLGETNRQNAHAKDSATPQSTTLPHPPILRTPPPDRSIQTEYVNPTDQHIKLHRYVGIALGPSRARSTLTSEN